MDDEICKGPEDHIWQAVEHRAITDQDTRSTGSSTADLLFEFDGKCRCIKCGTIDSGHFIRTMELEFRLEVRSIGEDGPEGEGAIL